MPFLNDIVKQTSNPEISLLTLSQSYLPTLTQTSINRRKTHSSIQHDVGPSQTP